MSNQEYTFKPVDLTPTSRPQFYDQDEDRTIIKVESNTLRDSRSVFRPTPIESVLRLPEGVISLDEKRAAKFGMQAVESAGEHYDEVDEAKAIPRPEPAGRFNRHMEAVMNVIAPENPIASDNSSRIVETFKQRNKIRNL